MNEASPPSAPRPQSSVLIGYIVPFVLNMALVAWLAFGLDPQVNGHDFMQNGWLPAKLIIAGGNPYQPNQAQVHRLADAYLPMVAVGDTEFNSGADYNAIYPYWALLLQTPLALLDFPAALIVWTLLSGALLLVGLYLMLAAVRQRLAVTLPPLIWAATLLVFGLVSIFFMPTLLHLFLGQYSILMMFLLALLFATINSSPVWVAPLALALATMKPQLTALVLAIVLLSWLIAAQWRKVVVALGAIAALYLVPILFAPYAFSGWFSVNFMVQKQSTRLIPASSSWWGLCWHLVRPVIGDWWVPLATLLSLATLALLLNPLRHALAARDVMAVLPLAIIVTLLVTPYTIGYDQVILLLPAAWLWLMLQGHAGLARTLRLALALWLTLLPLWQLSLVADTGRNYPRIIQTLALLGLYYLINYATDERADEPLTELGLVADRDVATD